MRVQELDRVPPMQRHFVVDDVPPTTTINEVAVGEGYIPRPGDVLIVKRVTVAQRVGSIADIVLKRLTYDVVVEYVRPQDLTK